VEANVVTGGPRRVALYGGSFDPPHNGHVLLATWVLCRADIDALWLLPAAGHAFGKRLTPFSTRCELLRAAFQHLGPRVHIETIEAELPTPSYTVDTLRALTTRHPGVEFSLILGRDAFETRHQWKEWEALERLIDGRVLVVGREGHGPPSDTPEAVVLPDFSSTAVRRAVAAGEPSWWMVPEPVARLIEAGGLYR
jgi:nicotinate-nucleotide adenylyltransferase